MKNIFLVIFITSILFPSLATSNTDLFQGTYLCEEKQSTGFMWENNTWVKKDFNTRNWIFKRHEDSKCDKEAIKMQDGRSYGCFELYPLGEEHEFGFKWFSQIYGPPHSEGHVFHRIIYDFTLELNGNFMVSLIQSLSKEGSNSFVARGQCRKID